MAYSQANSTKEPRSFSLGPLKAQILTFSVVSGDTSATVTADKLARLDHVLINGVDMTSAPSFSGNSATIAFADPAANRSGTILCLGV